MAQPRDDTRAPSEERRARPPRTLGLGLSRAQVRAGLDVSAAEATSARLVVRDDCRHPEPRTPSPTRRDTSVVVTGYHQHYRQNIESSAARANDGFRAITSTTGECRARPVSANGARAADVSPKRFSVVRRVCNVSDCPDPRVCVHQNVSAWLQRPAHQVLLRNVEGPLIM